MKTTIYNLLFPLMLVGVLDIAAVQAETFVSGDVSGVWNRAGSPYTITGRTSVPDRSQLYIQAGVSVRSLHGDPLVVEGRLIAVGTEADSIKFAPVGWLPTWGGIRFFDADSGTRLAYCLISYGRRFVPSLGDTSLSGGNAVIFGGKVTVEHTSFLGGSASFSGGGIAIYRSSPIISECLFQGNSSLVGGAFSCLDSANPALENCRFVGNIASWGGGGGFTSEASSPRISDCEFEENNAGPDAEGGYGGALFIYGGADPLVVNSKFKANSANQGGAIYVSGAGCAARFFWSDFFYNHTDSAVRKGGAVAICSGSPTLFTNCRFVGNTAEKGGAIHLTDSPRCALHNLLFVSNQAVQGGGAVYLDGGFDEDTLKLDRCTFTNNLQTGGAVATANTIWSRFGSNILLNSSILLGPSPIIPESGSVLIRYCNIEGGGEGEGNSDANPRFYGLDSTWRLLKGDSPCIDSGDETLPADPDGSRADRGWISFPHNAWNGLATDSISIELLAGGEIRMTVRWKNRTGTPFFASPQDLIDFQLTDLRDASAITGDQTLNGAVWANGGYYLCGAGGQIPPSIYKLDQDLQLLSQFQQPGSPQGSGYFDLASDGGSVMLGGDNRQIVEFTTDGEFGERYSLPDGVIDRLALTADYTFSSGFCDFYVAGSTDTLVRCSSDMRAAEVYHTNVDIYSLAMRRNARAVYIIGEIDNQACLLSLNPVNGSIAKLADVELPEGYSLGGCEIARGLSPEKDKLIGVLRGASVLYSDLLFQADLYTSWIGIIPEPVLLMPWEEATWEVVITGNGIPPGDYTSAFEMSANGWGEPGRRVVSLHLLPNSEREAPVPTSYPLLSVWPNPFNGELNLRFALDRPDRIVLSLIDPTGRQIALLSEGHYPPGAHKAAVSLPNLPSGQYFARLEGSDVKIVIPVSCLK